MDKIKLVLSIRFRHPCMDPDEIIGNTKCLDVVPDIVQGAGLKRKLPNGKDGYGENDETYVTFKYIETSDIDLANSIESANQTLLCVREFINKFTGSGGSVDYYISVVSERWYAFELEPKILEECANLKIIIGVEIFADIERSENS